MVVIGDIVWAKLRGYPWWPARIEKIQNLPAAIKSSESDSVPIYFFGSRDYALINNDSIKPFDDTNWNLFKGKSSAPKFKAALSEARKMSQNPTATLTNSKTTQKKRGRPRKLQLTESRKRLQVLFQGSAGEITSTNTTTEIISILEQILSSSNEFSKKCYEESKLGNLLKVVFCSTTTSGQYEKWHKNHEILLLVQQVAKKIKSSK